MRSPSLNRAILRIATPSILGLLTIAALAFLGMQRLRTNQASETFDVVSVKPSAPGTNGMSVTASPGGRFVANGITVATLILNAYELKDFQVVGGPSWIDSRRYDITGVSDASDPQSKNVNEKSMQRKLQALLADRFRFKSHMTETTQTVYSLVVWKNRLKVEKVEEGGSLSVGSGQMISKGISMSNLAENLSFVAGHEVLDGTNLPGYYAFRLEWATDPIAGSPGADGPSFFDALKEQLGLALVPRKGPVRILTIDHVEPPSPN